MVVMFGTLVTRKKNSRSESTAIPYVPEATFIESEVSGKMIEANDI
jgi:hypothetical protein